MPQLSIISNQILMTPCLICSIGFGEFNLKICYLSEERDLIREFIIHKLFNHRTKGKMIKED